MRAHLAVLALVLLVQTVEHAGADTELTMVDQMPALGETARLEEFAAPAKPDALTEELKKTDPTVDATPTKLTPQEKPDPNKLEKELSAMVDANGQSPITGKLVDPVGTKESKVANEMPALDANAMMAAGKIAAKNAAAQLAAAVVKFRAIPSLKYGANGVTKEGATQAACENACKSDMKCVSYSYSAKTSTCITSTSLVQYDLEFSFFAKKQQKVEGVAAFRKLGAMKYFSPKGDKSVRAFPGIKQGGCQTNCAKAPDCNSFAYRKGDSMCLTSTQDIKYDADWSYHEKVGAAELLAMKAKEASSIPALAAKKPADNKAPTKDDKAEDKKLEAADESSLSSSQLATLKAKKNTGSVSQAKAVLLDGLAAKAALLNNEEAARVEVATQLKAKADAKADVENSLEKKGKAIFKSDLAATKGKLDTAVAKAEKAGWTLSEQSAKSAEKSRENTQKTNEATAAIKLRTKTEDGISLTAQKELEARDTVADIEQRKGLYKTNQKESATKDAAKAAEIKRQKDAMAAAAQTLIDAHNHKALDKAKAEAKAEQQKSDDAARAIREKNLQITQIDAKITSLNTDKASQATAVGDADGKVKGTTDEIAMTTEPDQKVVLEKRLLSEKEHQKTVQEKAKVVDDQLSELAEKVTAGNEFISKSSTKKGQADAAVAAAKLAVTTEKERLEGLGIEGKKAMDMARYKKNQALAREFQIKMKIVDQTKSQLKFEESDKKAALKEKDVKSKLTELQDSKKAQDVEEKIKTAIKFKEIASKKQKKVDDVVKEAKQDEVRSVKMLSDGKYAQVTAVTTDQKVAAASTVSDAAALKATSEQKLTALAPSRQAAKEAAAAAKDKLDALKALFGSDEAGFKKAMSAFNKADGKLDKEKVNGEVENAKKLAAEKKKLAAESASLAGATMNEGAAPAGSNKGAAREKESSEIKQKIDKARKNQKDPLAGFDKEKAEKAKLAANMNKETSIEKNTKNEIAVAEERQERTKKEEVKQAAMESTQKTKLKMDAKSSSGSSAVEAAKILERTKRDEAMKATMQESNAKTDAQALQLKEKAQKTKEASSSSSGVTGCDVGTLEAKETCTKNKAKELESSETQAKTLAKDQEVQVKTHEKEVKSAEKAKKEGVNKHNAKDENKTKEKATKESEQKSTTDESSQKENKKKEMKTKDTARKVKEQEDAKKESGAKADAKMTAVERTKEDAAREAKTKTAEKTSKSDEGGTKEKTAKEEKTAKQEKSTREQMDESAVKKQASMTEETKNKGAAEKDEKAIKQKEMQASQSEKATKEKTTKGSAEAATKQTAADNQKEQTEKELAQKKTAADSANAASSEKQTKDSANEQAAKETKQKGAAAIQAQSESAAKSNANEQANKVPARL